MMIYTFSLLLFFLSPLSYLGEILLHSKDYVRVRALADAKITDSALRICASIQNINRINRSIFAAQLQCPLVVEFPPALAALKVQVNALVVFQELSLKKIELERALLPSSATSTFIFSTPQRSKISSPCLIPGELKWSSFDPEPIIQFKDSISGFGVYLSKFNLKPFWMFQNESVRAL